MTDGELIAQLLGPHFEDAFDTVVQLNTDVVYGVCLRVLNDAARAEDATQATFMVLLKKRTTLSTQLSLSGWLYHVAQQVARNMRKSQLRQEQREREAGSMQPRTASESSWEKVRPALDEALASLPAAQRDAVVLRYMRGLSRDEIARTLNCPEPTVQTRLKRALVALRAQLSRRGAQTSAAALAGVLTTHAMQAAPAHLSATIKAACLGKAVASPAAVSAANAVSHALSVAKFKTAALLAFAAVALVGVTGLAAQFVMTATSHGAPATSVTAPAAVILYVDQDHATGTAGDGSSGNPFKTIQQAMSAATAGTDIRIRKSAAPYDESATAANSGTLEKPIVIEADDPHNPPVLRYSGQGKQAAALHIGGKDYWTIQNLSFDGTGVFTSTMAIWISGRDWKVGPDTVGNQILNNTFKHWGGSEAQHESTPNNPAVIGVDNGWEPPLGAHTITGTVIRGNYFDGNRLNGIVLMSTRNTLVEDNEIVNMLCGRELDGSINAKGIKIATGNIPIQMGDLVIRNNRIHDFQPSPEWKLKGQPNTYPIMGGIWIACAVENGTVEDNQIWNLDGANPGSASPAWGLFIGADCYGWTVKNNLFHDIGAGAVITYAAHPGATNRYVNNTIYNAGTEGFHLGSGNTVVENNIFAGSPATAQLFVDANAIGQGNIAVRSNVYWGPAGKVARWDNGPTASRTLTFSAWKTASGQDAEALVADPQFVNPAAGNFRLQPKSPAAGRGMQFAPDAGAVRTRD